MSSGKTSSQGLADEMTAEAISSLGNTVGTFATRINRKLKEKEELDDVSARQAEIRHARMLQAMTTIRKALQETCKIKLGDRFHFALKVSDWEGWPRVALNLVDKFAPQRVDYSMIVTANDRNSLGSVVINTLNGDTLGRVQLCDSAELNRLPLVLKKSVRQYLDVVANYVLNPVAPEDLLETVTKNITSAANEVDEIGAKLQDTNVFSEENGFGNDNRVSEHDDLVPIEAASVFSK